MDEFEDLGLDRDIERGRRLVGDQQIRFGDQRHGDHDALAHAAGKFVRITFDPAGGVLDADLLKHLKRHFPGAAAVDPGVNEQRLDELVLDAQIGIQRSHRVLENHRDAFAPDFLKFPCRAADQVNSVEYRPTAFDPGGGLRNQAEQGIAGHRLAGAGFADDAQRFTFLDVKRHVVHRPHNAVARVEERPQILDFKQRHSCSFAFSPPKPGRPERRAGRRRES